MSWPRSWKSSLTTFFRRMDELAKELEEQLDSFLSQDGWADHEAGIAAWQLSFAGRMSWPRSWKSSLTAFFSSLDELAKKLEEQLDIFLSRDGWAGQEAGRAAWQLSFAGWLSWPKSWKSSLDSFLSQDGWADQETGRGERGHSTVQTRDFFTLRPFS